MFPVLENLRPLIRQGYSCTIYTRHGRQDGALCLRQGLITHAEFADLEPVAALNTILSRKCDDFTISTDVLPGPATIPECVSTLLSEPTVGS